MPNIDKININGTEYNIIDSTSDYTSFEYTPAVTSGTIVGKMTFNGTTYTIYAPPQSSSGGLNVSINSDQLRFFTDNGLS